MKHYFLHCIIHILVVCLAKLACQIDIKIASFGKKKSKRTKQVTTNVKHDFSIHCILIQNLYIYEYYCYS